MPPISSGSTVRVASTLRPEACSIWATIARASSSDSSKAVVSSTVTRPCARSTSASNSSAIPRDLPGAALRGEQAEEVADELVGALGELAERRRPSRAGSSCGLARNACELGRRLDRVDELAEVALDRVDAAAAPRAASKRARRVHAVRRRPRSSLCPAPAPRSRARRSPRRSGAAGRAESSTLPMTRCGRLERQLGDLAADLVDRARRLGLDLLARLLEPALALGLGLLLRPLAIWASATLRASARISSASDRGLGRAARGAARAAPAPRSRACVGLVDRLRGSARGARRSSSGSGRTRTFLSTKNVIAKQIDRPDHQPRGDLDQGVRCERRRSTQTRT